MRFLAARLIVFGGVMLAAGMTEGKGPACEGVATQISGVMRCVKPIDSFRDCPNCPEMEVVPAGSFMMGSDQAGDEMPVHRSCYRGHLLSEVTFAEWEACVAEGGCKHRPGDQGWGRGSRPVIDISWNDIRDSYLPWLSHKIGRRYRLLSEAEWEYAARAGSDHRYAWGDDIGSGRANCDRCGSAWDNKQTAPAGSFPPSAFGLHDMHGNVWEWTADCYQSSYEGASAKGGPRRRADCETRVVRGGGWSDRPQYLRSAIRYGDPPHYRGNYVGFRVARSL